MNKIEHIEYLIKMNESSNKENSKNIDDLKRIEKLKELIYRIGEVSTQVYILNFKESDVIHSAKFEINSAITEEEVEYYFKNILHVNIISLKLIEKKMYRLPKKIY